MTHQNHLLNLANKKNCFAFAAITSSETHSRSALELSTPPLQYLVPHTTNLSLFLFVLLYKRFLIWMQMKEVYLALKCHTQLIHPYHIPNTFVF